jgi:2-polyprenyl-3-methyl-5-hydroxy-6-metoxy-1,4-benzoquinol methylase
MKTKLVRETVTVDLDKDTPYLEPDSRIYRIKRRLMYSNIIRIIDKHIGKQNSSNILDVGTGSGFLLSFLENEFPYSSFYGLEYDPRLVQLSNSKLTRSRVFPGDAEHFHEIGSFDLVVSSQVIEHLFNPQNFISSVKSVLNNDGILIFTTPNLDCLAKRLLGVKWHGFHHDHVSLKSRKEWDQFMTDNGFEIIYSGTTFFSGIPVLNKFPLGIFNWMLLYFLGSMRWNLGESYVGVFKVRRDTI